MGDYFNRFVELSLKTTCSWDALKDKNIRRNHNRAMTSLHLLQLEEMYMEPDRCTEVAARLLVHDDVRVCLHAAAYCIKAEVHVQQALALLDEISGNDPDRWVRTTARLNKELCVPFSMQ